MCKSLLLTRSAAKLAEYLSPHNNLISTLHSYGSLNIQLPVHSGFEALHQTGKRIKSIHRPTTSQNKPSCRAPQSHAGLCIDLGYPCPQISLSTNVVQWKWALFFWVNVSPISPLNYSVIVPYLLELGVITTHSFLTKNYSTLISALVGIVQLLLDITKILIPQCGLQY